MQSDYELLCFHFIIVAKRKVTAVTSLHIKNFVLDFNSNSAKLKF